MKRFKIRFNGTEFTANEDALVQIINLSSSKDEFYVINEENPEAMLDSFTEWKYEDNQPLAIVVDGKIKLKSQEDKMQEYMWEDIADEFREWNRLWDKYNSYPSSTARPKENKKDLLKRLQRTYKIEKR